jgi:hypothetical protein
MNVMIVLSFSFFNSFHIAQCATKGWMISRNIFSLLELKLSKNRIFIFGEGAAPTNLQNHEVPNNKKQVNEWTLIFISTSLSKKDLAWTS